MPNYYSVITNNDIGVTTWYKLGTTIRHREGGPAVETRSGYKVWWVNGYLHREDGPAIESPNGDKFWYQNGVLHRLDGPAVKYANGIKFWYVAGAKYSEKEFNELLHPTKEEIVQLNGEEYRVLGIVDNYKIVELIEDYD